MEVSVANIFWQEGGQNVFTKLQFAKHQVQKCWGKSNHVLISMVLLGASLQKNTSYRLQTYSGNKEKLSFYVDPLNVNIKES